MTEPRCVNCGTFLPPDADSHQCPETLEMQFRKAIEVTIDTDKEDL